MGQTVKKFKLLLWKNFILQKRHKVQTVVEIIVPLLFTFILVIIKSVVSSDDYGETTYGPFDPRDIMGTAVPKGHYILYAPDTPEVQALMKKVEPKLQSEVAKFAPPIIPPTAHYKFRHYPNETKLIEEYLKRGDNFPRPTKPTQFDVLLYNENPVLAAVVFMTEDFPKNKNIKYRLRFPAKLHNPGLPVTKLPLAPRWETEFLYELYPLPRDRDHVLTMGDLDKRDGPEGTRHKERGGIPGYWSEGFLYLQSLIDEEIIKLKATKTVAGVIERLMANIRLNRYPYPKYTDDEFIAALQINYPVFIMLSFMYSVINISKSIAHEKERRLKEAMKIMGLPNWLHWCAWFIKSIIFLSISTLIMTFFYVVPMFKNGKGILKYADPTLLFTFFMLYAFSTITFGFLISTFFSTANAASTASGVVFFLTYFPYFFLRPRYAELSRDVKMSLSIFSNVAMSLGCQLIATFEGTGTGIKWGTIADPVGPDDNISLLDTMIMLVVDGVIYLLVAIYIESVFPGDYGIPLPWYYPFTKWYWTDSPREKATIEVTQLEPRSNPEYFEKEPDGYAGIQIMGLTKKFGKKVAVNDLYLNFYENQVTALLGHNGAGKTTTMSIITGMFPATSGTAIVNGYDINSDMKSVRGSLGLCPQHDVLFDELTVEEHLRFFCLLKGVSKQFLHGEIDRMLGVIMLEKKRHAQSHTLSGGMKRKLSVGIALIGGSKVVLLDEPTSGMDPTARRSTWDLITSEKKGRTIVLSTHFMDEADLLGDRVAIMADGQAQCCGSSLFLKKKYGGGYHLIIAKEGGCKVDQITNLIQKRMPEVKVDQNIGAELSYSLPDEKSALFPEMFEELEMRKQELGIASYGCSITQMEEVFMRVGEQLEEKIYGKKPNPDDQILEGANTNSSVMMSEPSSYVETGMNMSDDGTDEKRDDENAQQELGNDSNVKDSTVETMVQETDNTNRGGESAYSERRKVGCYLLLQQFRGLMVKKWLYSRRNWIFVLGQIFVVILFVIIAIILFKTLPDLAIPKERIIDLEQYSRFSTPITAINCNSNPICSDYIDFLQEVYPRFETKMVSDLTKFILDKSGDSGLNLPEVNSRYIVGLEGNTGFFNNQPFHTPPLALNLMTNAILRKVADPGQQGSTITVSNYPLPYREVDTVTNLVETENEGSFIGFTTAFGMSFLAASFVTFVVKERETKSKHLQFVSGVRFPMFWLAHFLFDAVNYLITVIALMITLIACQASDFKDFEEKKQPIHGYFLIVALSYGWAVIPLMYLFSFLFTVPAAGYTKMTLFNFLSGMATFLTIAILQLKALSLTYVANRLEWVFMFFPNFDLGYAITVLTKNRKLQMICPKVLPLLAALGKDCPTEKDLDKEEDPCCHKFDVGYLAWEQPGVLRHVVYMLVIGLVSIIILVLIESKIFEKIKYIYEKKKYAKISTTEGAAPAPSDSENVILEDDDVAAENARIRWTLLTELFQTENMILRDLTKHYGGFLAVDKLCLGVKPGECFGLLGVNGAGKTTTFKMLTGDIPITAGDAYIVNRSVKADIKRVQQVLGYCPQFDALIPELTGRETIWLFARLRGIPERSIDRLANKLGDHLIFRQHMDKPCGTYSGGNKRKLSTALALIGSPPIVFLDEPTTGMDPVARRHLWNTILNVRESGTSVILTSHSMEECEALCTRLAIMVNGKFRCLGSGQHLKNKFGDGYTLIAQMASTSLDLKKEKTSVQLGKRKSSLIENQQEWEKELQPLRSFIEENFPGCTLKEIHPQYLHYHINVDGGVTWGDIFRKMEEAKTLFELEAYSVGQTTLEQVFLTFTQVQA